MARPALPTLLVIASYYDSVEMARGRALTEFRRRAQRRNWTAALVLTLVEALLVLAVIRWLWRFGWAALRRLGAANAASGASSRPTT